MRRWSARLREAEGSAGCDKGLPYWRSKVRSERSRAKARRGARGAITAKCLARASARLPRHGMPRTREGQAPRLADRALVKSPLIETPAFIECTFVLVNGARTRDHQDFSDAGRASPVTVNAAQPHLIAL